jgi:TRAP-type C4-dicarboxylate transport system substrate-binding protein
MSTHALEKLNDQEKKWLMQAVRESVKVQRKEWNKSEKNALKSVVEEGVEIIKPDKQPFIDAVQDVYNLYKDNKDLSGLIKRIEAANPALNKKTTEVQPDSATVSNEGTKPVEIQ